VFKRQVAVLVEIEKVLGRVFGRKS